MLAFLLFFIFFPSLALSQDMSGLNSKLEDETPCRLSFPKEYCKILKEDDTNHQPYQSGKFTCNEFALRLYLQLSDSAHGDYDYQGFEKNTGIKFQEKIPSQKIPIVYVSLSNKKNNFYHAINAILTNPDHPEDPSSYIFIEPQTDYIMNTIEEVYNNYKNHYPSGGELEFKISHIKSYKSNGNIYQSWTDKITQFKMAKKEDLSSCQNSPQVLPKEIDDLFQVVFF